MVSIIEIALGLSKHAKPIILPTALVSLAFATYISWYQSHYLIWFFSGPGFISRIVALLLVIFNWKSLPLTWTVSICF